MQIRVMMMSLLLLILIIVGVRRAAVVRVVRIFVFVMLLVCQKPKQMFSQFLKTLTA